MAQSTKLDDDASLSSRRKRISYRRVERGAPFGKHRERGRVGGGPGWGRRGAATPPIARGAMPLRPRVVVCHRCPHPSPPFCPVRSPLFLSALAYLGARTPRTADPRVRGASRGGTGRPQGTRRPAGRRRCDRQAGRGAWVSGGGGGAPAAPWLRLGAPGSPRLPGCAEAAAAMAMMSPALHHPGRHAELGSGLRDGGGGAPLRPPGRWEAAGPQRRRPRGAGRARQRDAGRRARSALRWSRPGLRAPALLARPAGQPFRPFSARSRAPPGCGTLPPLPMAWRSPPHSTDTLLQASLAWPRPSLP